MSFLYLWQELPSFISRLGNGLGFNFARTSFLEKICSFTLHASFFYPTVVGFVLLEFFGRNGVIGKVLFSVFIYSLYLHGKRALCSFS